MEAKRWDETKLSWQQQLQLWFSNEKMHASALYKVASHPCGFQWLSGILRECLQGHNVLFVDWLQSALHVL